VLILAISKRLGNAVVRNRLRRQFREVARTRLRLVCGYYLVRARPGAANLDFAGLSSHFARAAGGLFAGTTSRTVHQGTGKPDTIPQPGSPGEAASPSVTASQ
jgi:ribonuclease P protein component